MTDIKLNKKQIILFVPILRDQCDPDKLHIGTVTTSTPIHKSATNSDLMKLVMTTVVGELIHIGGVGIIKAEHRPISGLTLNTYNYHIGDLSASRRNRFNKVLRKLEGTPIKHSDSSRIIPHHITVTFVVSKDSMTYDPKIKQVTLYKPHR
jgi:hypothetical protein